MEKATNFDELCRLCGELGPNIIPVFGEEGRSQCLQEKIENNVKVTVSEHDELPKGICTNCSENVCNIGNFVRQCQETQEKLQEFLAIQQSLWLVESQTKELEGSSEENLDYEDTHSIDHNIDISDFECKEDVVNKIQHTVPDTFTCIVTKGDDAPVEKDIGQLLEMPGLLQEERADGNALLRLPSSGSTKDSSANFLFVNCNESDGPSKTPCIISVKSENTQFEKPQIGSLAEVKPLGLAEALKGQPLTTSPGVKVIRRIHTIDSSTPDSNGRQRKKVVLLVSKPPNVEMPSVLNTVLQSQSLPNTSGRLATITTGELLIDRKTKRFSTSQSLAAGDEIVCDVEESTIKQDDDTILTLEDPKTSDKVQIRLKQEPKEVAFIDQEESLEYVEDETMLEYPDKDEDYEEESMEDDDEDEEDEEEEEIVAEPPVGDMPRREVMRKQMVRRAHLAREKARRRSERAKVKRAAIKKLRDEEKVKKALEAVEEMMKQRESEDLTVRNKPLPPEFRKIKRMLARRGMLPEKCVKKKRIDMPYKDKVAEHISKLSPTEFQCKLCLEIFRWNYKCEQHILNHTGERPFKCHICGKSYKENCVLDQHMRMHKDKYLFVCEECGAGFKRRYLLSYHTRRYHGEEVRLLCEDCGKVFHARETLNAHVRYHHKKRMVVCDVCGQVVRNSEMGRHRRKHGPLSSCPLCSRMFRRHDARERHIAEHDNPALPAHCIACGKYFRGRRSLMEHLERIHKLDTEGDVIPKLEPEQDSLVEVEEDDEEDSRTSNGQTMHLEVHDLLDTDDVGATEQISLEEGVEEEEARAASHVLDEIAATVLLQE